MTDTDRMLSWLREAMDAAQHDAEEAAEESGGPQWHGSDSGLYSNDAANHPGPFLADAYGYTDPRLVTHITRNDPAAVLRRIDRDRKTLAEHEPETFDPGHCAVCVTNRKLAPEWWEPDAFPCTTVRLLAEGWGWTEETP